MVSVVISLLLLGVFKYADFFISSINKVTGLSVPLLRIALPIGISFYTFQALSYTIDVHRNKIEATNDPIAFFAFVSFFPQLVAGPIERATNLLPQFMRERTFDYDMAADGKQWTYRVGLSGGVDILFGNDVHGRSLKNEDTSPFSEEQM